MDEILLKWLKGELTDKELKNEIGEEQATRYIQILSEVDSWVPDHSEQLLNPLEITSKPKAKVVSMQSFLRYAAAAVLVISIISYFWLFNSNGLEIYTSQIGEVRSVELPDGSEVTLAPNSEISWDKDEWKESVAMKENRLKSDKSERKVKLKGKALFKIEKGKPFSVASKNGTVEVLGTTFEVDDFEEGFSVICFEGKVRAKPLNRARSMTITKREGYLFFKGKWEPKRTIDTDAPEWLQNQTKFENAPLAQVIISLEKTYGITIDKQTVNISRRFTGTFPNDKLQVALKIVFTPFKIDYTIDGKKVTLSES